MNTRQIPITEIYQQTKETITEIIKSKALSFYPIFVIYSLTIIFLLWIAKIVLF